MVVEDKLYFGCSLGDYKGFYCLNATTGEIIWVHDPITNYDGCTPAIVDGKVYINNDFYLYCLNAETGAEIWNSPDKPTWASPAIYNNRVYTNAYEMYCLDAENGDELWNYPNGDWYCSPAIAYGNVYAGNLYNYKVYCLGLETGDLNWESISLGYMINDVAIADDKVFIPVGGHETLSKLVCLDAHTGEVLWDYPLGGMHCMYSAPAVAYGNVYVGAGENGYIYAFGTPNERPNIPVKPDGPDNGKTNKEYIINSTTTDPEDDDIYYLFDWGDGYNSGWIGPYTSGEEVSASHIWTEIGDYEIRVKSHDGRRESDWSEPLTILITSLPPDAPIIDGPTSGKQGTYYNFTFNSVDPDGEDVYYYIKWGDNSEEDWNGPHPSGVDFEIAHSFPFKKTFTIEAKAKDISDAESNWTYFDVEIPRTRATFNLLFPWFLERFPILEKLLTLIRVF